MFEDLIGAKVRIIKKDKFSKVGILLRIEKDFVVLRMNDGEAYIAIESIDTIQKINGGT